MEAKGWRAKGKENYGECISAAVAEEWTRCPGMPSPVLGAPNRLLVLCCSAGRLWQTLAALTSRRFGHRKQHVVFPRCLCSGEYLCRLYLSLHGEKREIAAWNLQARCWGRAGGPLVSLLPSSSSLNALEPARTRLWYLGLLLLQPGSAELKNNFTGTGPQMSFKRMARLGLRGESTTWFLNPRTPPGSKALFLGWISAWKQRICPFCHSPGLEIFSCCFFSGWLSPWMLLWKQALQQRLTLASGSSVFVTFSAFATLHWNIYVLLQRFTQASSEQLVNTSGTLKAPPAALWVLGCVWACGYLQNTRVEGL